MPVVSGTLFSTTTSLAQHHEAVDVHPRSARDRALRSQYLYLQHVPHRRVQTVPDEHNPACLDRLGVEVHGCDLLAVQVGFNEGVATVAVGDANGTFV